MDKDYDISHGGMSSGDQLPPFEEITEEEVKHESPEQIVATNVSQQLMTNALQQQRHDLLAEELMTTSDTKTQSSEQPIHQNIEFQSEQRFSGHPIQQYIYDEEEEDEEEEDMDVKHGIGRPFENIMASNVSSNTRNETIDDLMNQSIGSQKSTKEEILYQLSDNNVLTAQSYGIGSDLRIGSHLDQSLGEVSDYELNTEDPFSTPHKKIETEDNFERFVDKCEPFETIGTDYEMSSERDLKNNLLELDTSIGQKSGISRDAPKESHPLVESKPESEYERNPALSSRAQVVSDEKLDVLPSGADITHTHSLNASQSKSSNSEFTITPTLASTQSPNLDTFNQTLSQTTHISEDIPQKRSFETTSEPLKPLVQQSADIKKPKIDSSTDKQKTSEVTSSAKTMTKQESEHVVTTSAATASATDESNCPFSSSAWFNPSHFNPTVVELVYWRDPKKSGVVFGAGLLILLSLTLFSIISVVAYTSLAILSLTLSFRIYKNILQAVQKTNEGHPFKEYLDIEITPSSERIHKIVDSLLGHVNCTVNKLRSVFLVEDIIDSIKFGVLFWCLTYIGSWFNGLTLVILAYLGLFSLPKVYEMHKTQIDQYLSLASNQIHDITSKVRAMIPFPAAKKEKDN